MKDPALQPLVFENCVNQIIEGNRSIVGLMMESNINFGGQDLPKLGKANLAYGVSVTDPCLDWGRTEECLRHAHERLLPVLPKR